MVKKMIREWLLARILKGKTVFFEEDNEYKLINDIYFDNEQDVVICKKTDLFKWINRDYMPELMEDDIE